MSNTSGKMVEFHLFRNFNFCGMFIIMVVEHIIKSDAYCSVTSGGVKRFGQDCAFRCHCLDSTEQCNFDTGECGSGCAFEWTGPGCQHENIALEKESRHLDNTQPPMYSNFANDRNVTSCSFTAEASNWRQVAPWWALWYPSDKIFREFEFLSLSSHLSYFSSFNVTVQKGISKSDHERKVYHDGQLCYQQIDTTPQDSIVHLKCINGLVGNQLRIQLATTSTQLVLCDVRVNGECKDRMWGDGCNNTCGLCKDLLQCNVTNGHCSQGCVLGYKTTFDCKTECDSGTYGDNCQENCSGSCKQTVCNKENGTCTYGCIPGYKDDKCDQECSDGTYGIDCQRKCSSNCDVLCNKTDGTCMICKAGWKGNNCTTECGDGTYGKGCKNNCSVNCDGFCDKANGTCQSCNAGWKGNNCSTFCDAGTFGKGCKNNCSVNCDDLCNNVDGTCPSCRAGWKGNNCTTKCENGTYGFGCTKVCGECKQTSHCHKATGICSEGCKEGYTGSLCLKKVPQSFPVAGVAGGTSSAIVFVALVVAVLVYLRKRQQSKSPAVTSDHDVVRRRRKNENRQNVYCNASQFEKGLRNSGDMANPRVSEENECVYVNDTAAFGTKTEHEVSVSNLTDYVKKRLAETKYFEDEFQSIPYGIQYHSSVATTPMNVGKNRYKSIYAYDHSRVVLKKESQDDSDYINATNIMGYSCQISYIAAQGPIQNTLDDFWRMIWEKNILTIVMATNLTEAGKVNCVQYWPGNSKSVQYGHLNIVTDSEEEFTEFTVRRLKVSHEDKPEKCRLVTQFHYTAWPDKGVPRCTSGLLHFWYQVRKHDAEKKIPWLVHCSAGVGRTGTFIALDFLYDEGIDKGSINIYQCVSTLREQRVNMVQTKDQYKFLHIIMVEALALAWKPMSIDTFPTVYDKLRKVDQRTGKPQLQLQYETLVDEPEVVNEQESKDELYSSAKRSENNNKNRIQNILAPNEFRPFLCTRVTGYTDYINAIYIPSYRRTNAYIITQTPLRITAVDCCRLLEAEEVKIVVTFEDQNDEEVGVYLPERGSVKVGPFTSTFISEENREHFIMRNFEVKYESQKHSVCQLIFKHWLPSKPTPANANEMLYFLEEIERLQRLTDSKPIIIQCLNGAERSGLVAVLLNILERVRFDSEVSIIQVVRQLKVRRKQIIPNFEQYKFCHDVLLSHTQSNTTYANM